MYKEFGINEEIEQLSKKVEEEIKPIFDKINRICQINRKD